MSLRHKIVFTVLACSLAAIALAGGVAWLLRDAGAGGAAALAWACLLGLLLALVLGVACAGALARPLQTLSAAVRGGVPPQDVAGQDEYGELAAAFRQLRLALAQSEAALAAARAEVRAQAETLRELATRDALTGLHDSRYFDTHAATLFNLALRHGQHFAVVMGDIDFFKRINDSHSHALGDAVLRQVATLLQANVRHTDLLARYGGEEFVIAFPQTTQEQAQQLCEKLRGVIEAWPWFDLHPALHVTISMGVATNLGHGSVEDMLRAADAQLYRAKNAGRNQVCVPA